MQALHEVVARLLGWQGVDGWELAPDHVANLGQRELILGCLFCEYRLDRTHTGSEQFLQSDQLANGSVCDFNPFNDLGFGQLVHHSLDHRDCILRSSYSYFYATSFLRFQIGVNDEFSIFATDANASDGAVKRCIRNHQRC